MTAYHIRTFNGEIPKLSRRLLPEDMADSAIDCKFDSGQITPWKDNTLVQALPTSNAISTFLYRDDHWFSWDKDVDIVRSQIAGDTDNTVYFTGDGYPKMTKQDLAIGVGAMPDVSYRLGIPAPESLSFEVLNTGNGEILRETLYTYTFVNAFGEEGPPATPTDLITVEGDQEVTLTLPAPPTGDFNFGSGSLKRIYRTAAGNANSEFQLVAQTPIGNTTFVDTVGDDVLGEIMPTEGWLGPADDDLSKYPQGPMVGLTALPNGGMVGFFGNTLAFCEPYIPYAWPYAYRFSITSKVVAIANTSAGLVVGTTGKPYAAIGYDPTSINLIEIDVKQACVSKRSMVDMGIYALYASPDGLVSAAGTQAELITDRLITREQWQALNPESIHAFHYDGRYFGFYDNGIDKRGFIFDPRGGKNALMWLSFYAVGGYADLKTDSLYLIGEDNNLYLFDSHANSLVATWRSKEFVSSRPINMGWLRVQASGYPVTVNVYGDEGMNTQAVLSEEPTPLPAGFLSRSWSVEVVSNEIIDSVSIGESLREVI